LRRSKAINLILSKESNKHESKTSVLHLETKFNGNGNSKSCGPWRYPFGFGTTVIPKTSLYVDNKIKTVDERWKEAPGNIDASKNSWNHEINFLHSSIFDLMISAFSSSCSFFGDSTFLTFTFYLNLIINLIWFMWLFWNFPSKK